MTYVTSNPCGNAEKMRELMRRIRFSDRDLLYVIGNLADYGDEPMELIADMSVRVNVYPIAGERDYLAARMLEGIVRTENGQTPDADFVGEMSAWIRDGGMNTVQGFRALDADGREGVLEYLGDMTLFEETTIGGERYIMVYAGIADYEQGSDPEDYLPDDFFSEPLSRDRRLIPDATVIVGGVPTESGKIERGNGSIFLDCGVRDGGPLACLCLETGEEFYV